MELSPRIQRIELDPSRQLFGLWLAYLPLRVETLPLLLLLLPAHFESSSWLQWAQADDKSCPPRFACFSRSS